MINYTGGGSASTNNGRNQGIGVARGSDTKPGPSRGDNFGGSTVPQRNPSSPRQPIAKPRKPITRPIAPKSPPVNTVTQSIPVDSVPAYRTPSAPKRPIAQPVQPSRPLPSRTPQPTSQKTNIFPSTKGRNNVDPVAASGERGTGINPDYDDSEEKGYNYKIPENPLIIERPKKPEINPDYDNSEENGYNYKIPENPLIIERPKKRKQSSRQPSQNNDRLDAEAPLPIYGAPPEPFDDSSNNISNDILTPPEEEDVLPGYLPPDPRLARQGRKDRRLSSGRNQRRRFNAFSRRQGKSSK